MSRLIGWIGRIPVWIWLFLAATHVLTVVSASHRLTRLDQALLEMPDDRAFVGVRQGCEEAVQDSRFDRACAAVFGPVFLGLALWRWLRRPSETARAA